MPESLKSSKCNEGLEPSHGISNALRSERQRDRTPDDSSVHFRISLFDHNEAPRLLGSVQARARAQDGDHQVGDALFASAILKAAVIAAPRDRIASRRATPTRSNVERRSARARALARTSGRAASRRALYLNRHVSPRSPRRDDSRDADAERRLCSRSRPRFVIAD
jgi:hypothetical protein